MATEPTMTYRETIEFLFSSLPMFQRIGDAAIKKDLTNIKLLCGMLGDPHHAFPAIHIAGTNGKGSTSHMLASVFQAAGYTTGLYTSPHYVDFRERIRVNGEMISRREVVHFVKQYAAMWSSVQPSFFEITVAMAFDHFRRKKVDMAIIETGLGGRLDSTNIIHPLMSVITNIGFDHMNMLGDTLPEIAGEKAGIIKPCVPVVVGEWKAETAPVFREKAKREKAPIHFASRHLRVTKTAQGLAQQSFRVERPSGDWFSKITTDLTGPYQLQNLRTVLESLHRWNMYYPGARISDAVIRRGMRNVKQTTGMVGRWMILEKEPLVITDAAHNQHGMMAMLPELLRIRAQKRHIVLGFVNDKDVSKILTLFPNDAQYYWCSPDIPRGKPAEETVQVGAELGLYGKGYSSVKSAFKAARKAAGKKDLVFVGGSSYVVGDLLK